MNKFQRSWELFKGSLLVMQRDKQLLLFPVLTSVFTMLAVVLFLCPVALQSTGHSYISMEHWQAVGKSVFTSDNTRTVTSGLEGSPAAHGHTGSGNVRLRPVAAVYAGVMYLVVMFCATFCNVAFYQQILLALKGQPVSIEAGFRFALTRWRAIVMWTLFAGAVGLLIQKLEERFGWFGQWVLRLLGTAWSIACVFVIPVLITDEQAVNPFQVLKKSALTLKKTWGEALIGYGGVTFGNAVVMLISLLWLGLGITISMLLHVYWLIALVVLGWLTVLILWSYLLSVASQIFRCALYLYASEGALPAPYTQEMVALAWKVKK
jgi:Family of unknown function (DUF6159)